MNKKKLLKIIYSQDILDYKEELKREFLTIENIQKFKPFVEQLVFKKPDLFKILFRNNQGECFNTLFNKNLVEFCKNNSLKELIALLELIKLEILLKDLSESLFNQNLLLQAIWLEQESKKIITYVNPVYLPVAFVKKQEQTIEYKPVILEDIILNRKLLCNISRQIHVQNSLLFKKPLKIIFNHYKQSHDQHIPNEQKYVDFKLNKWDWFIFDKFCRLHSNKLLFEKLVFVEKGINKYESEFVKWSEIKEEYRLNLYFNELLRKA